MAGLPCRKMAAAAWLRPHHGAGWGGAAGTGPGMEGTGSPARGGLRGTGLCPASAGAAEGERPCTALLGLTVRSEGSGGRRPRLRHRLRHRQGSSKWDELGRVQRWNISKYSVRVSSHTPVVGQVCWLCFLRRSPPGACGSSWHCWAVQTGGTKTPSRLTPKPKCERCYSPRYG